MIDFLMSLEESAIGEWVAASAWGYAITLASHAVGMAIVVGLTAIIAINILGFPKAVKPSTLRALAPVLIFGLLLNFVSGVALFMAAASELFFNIAFQIKILMIIIGLILVIYLDKHLLKPMVNNGSVAVSQNHKIIAAITLAIWWLSVVLSGRLIGYIIYV